MLKVPYAAARPISIDVNRSFAIIYRLPQTMPAAARAARAAPRARSMRSVHASPATLLRQRKHRDGTRAPIRTSFKD